MSLPRRWKTGKTVGMHCTNMRAVDGQVKAVPLHGSVQNDVISKEMSNFSS